MKKNLFLLLLLAISFSCSQIMITPGPSGSNSPSEYMSPVVIYNAESETLTFDFSKCTGNIENHLYYERFSGGILTLHQMDQGRMIKTIIFKGSYFTRSTEDWSLNESSLEGLNIKISKNWTDKPHIIFENCSFSSSKSRPFIESEVDLLIEYCGNNKITSTSADALSLITAPNVEFKANDTNSNCLLTLNTVRNSTSGSIGIVAQTVTIEGGNLTIEGTNGLSYPETDREGRKGRDGSSGIKSSVTIVKNNAVVNITAGDGSNGSQGKTGQSGSAGANREFFLDGNAQNGSDGKVGNLGGAGGCGGSGIIGNLMIETGKVNIRAGSGGMGGRGGTGGAGGRGGDNWAAFNNPGNGGRAGSGGAGGTGGGGGDAISGTLILRTNNILYNLIKGIGGQGGAPGAAGSPGAAGQAKGSWGAGSASSGAQGRMGTYGSQGPNGVEHR